jgi:hypothetical protein
VGGEDVFEKSRVGLVDFSGCKKQTISATRATFDWKDDADEYRSNFICGDDWNVRLRRCLIRCDGRIGSVLGRNELDLSDQLLDILRFRLLNSSGSALSERLLFLRLLVVLESFGPLHRGGGHECCWRMRGRSGRNARRSRGAGCRWRTLHGW